MRLLHLLVVFMIVLPVAADAVTPRGTFEVGRLSPYSGFDDAVDQSLWIGARLEFRGVTQVGDLASISAMVHGGYSDLEIAEGFQLDASMWTLGAAGRAYARGIPIYLQLGVSYFSTDIALDSVGFDGSSSGFAPTAGLGVVFQFGGLAFDLGARSLHGPDADTDPRMVTYVASMSLPF